jgi:cytochrome o ubiquinol oxidase operon protein cyoD
MNIKKKLTAYVFGFALSLVLTLVAFGAVAGAVLPGIKVFWIVALLLVLATVQLGVQLILFLHLGDEPKPKWNLQAFCFAVLIVGIVVGGSLWIMNHLNHNMGHYNVFEEENITPHEHQH